MNEFRKIIEHVPAQPRSLEQEVIDSNYAIRGHHLDIRLSTILGLSFLIEPQMPSVVNILFDIRQGTDCI
ncbi:MAG: hypothetical protein M3270_00515 [Thermoproteota archaeon]|nr:hypothetical protein [Thermoproteota archaeon]